MFNRYLEKTNEKTTKYFEILFKKFFGGKKNIPNSIVLWGTDTISQYIFALEIARNLNCTKDRSVDCECINCKWIKTNTHPDIKTISKIDNKPENDKTKVISIDQIHTLIEEINMTSDAYRVIIFCDAEYEILQQDLVSHINEFKGYENIFIQKGEKYWLPKPLSQKVFQDTSTNALLKTIEEAPKNLLFIFLTSSPDDLISTIISRSQMFYVQNTYTPSYNFDFCKNLFNKFPNINRDDFNDFTQKSLAYMKDYDVKMQDFLELLQAYFTKLLSDNYKSGLKTTILSVIEKIILAKKYDLSTIKQQYILDDLWITISNL